ncbi:sn-glycerol-3-phosphate ABC transporter ATP-binding protein UgpC [Pokkaliibacter sp. MBI-7]|uniref:ABC transporter ATP-binding protein n=1 Tax=Pokkaliibacter sp. MBI-7 TaxID=3040600 RepID=UPI00244A0981|nr:sn-glycerol-3-phosphate ABC transporter ATP-binding protein UgpC [Pokkaliibacter sp. MBI-7]MDH2433733.1 sn-glycerol-3-phosphate ABC transporter ATP-binding protein UgpC [Pokkaliibacter sp. MBI-7]
MASLTLKKINKHYGAAHILRDVNLSIGDGEFVVFVGPSGCGKSTLLRVIAGLEDINSGELYIDTQEVSALPPKERGIGMVFQSYALYPHMTVYDNIAFGLQLAKASRETVAERVENTARILQLDTLLQRKPRALSGGQRQRVAMGRAIAREPRVMLFDEPLSNLDASLRVQMRMEIAKLHRRLGSTMIYVTHDQVEAMTLADKIVVLSGGRVEQVGTPYELYEHPATTFVAGFIGSPKMNLISGTVTRVTKDSVSLQLDRFGDLDLSPIPVHGLENGARITLGIRPEHLQLAAPTHGPKGEVINIEYLGNERFIYVACQDDTEPLLIRDSGPRSPRLGDQVGLVIAPQQCHLFDQQGRSYPRVLIQQQGLLDEANQPVRTANST